MKYRELIQWIENAGWRLDRQKGSHMIYRHRDRAGSVTIAGGGKLNRDVPRGTENAIRKQAGLTERQ